MPENNNILEKLEGLESRFEEVSTLITDPEVIADQQRFVKLTKEYKDLSDIMDARKRYISCLNSIKEAKDIMANESDADMREMAREELAENEALQPKIEEEIKIALIPKDPEDGKNVQMEIRAGTGGDEAALFAGDLFRMYSRYCEARGWKVNVMSASQTSLDGYKEILFTVVGDGAYGTFRFESGGHRVQRVPVTEAQGRIHTSAATVVVFPEADETDDDFEIPEKDLRIDIFCAGGHGGQGVNTTYSAIRMTHLPTGLVAQCQDERSQQRNKEKCLATLKARILDQKRREEEAKAGASRLSLRGSGDRSERIRTYNFPQNRLTDHRVDLTLYSLDRIIAGEMEPVLAALREKDLSDRIAAALGKAV